MYLNNADTVCVLMVRAISVPIPYREVEELKITTKTFVNPCVPTKPNSFFAPFKGDL